MIVIDQKRTEYIIDKACQLLIKHNVNTWPINPFPIIKKELDISPIQMANFAKIINADMEIKPDDKLGFSVYFPCLEKYGIIYNEKLKGQTIRWLIGHEYSHIAIGHVSQNGVPVFYNGTRSDPVMEAEAELFNRYFLAPPVIQEYMKINTAELVSLLFDIPVEIAQCVCIPKTQAAPDRRLFTYDDARRIYTPIEKKIISNFVKCFEQYELAANGLNETVEYNLKYNKRGFLENAIYKSKRRKSNAKNV